VATFGFNFNIYPATMARIEFGKDASGFGLLNSVMAIGSVAGALASAKREKPRLRFIFGAAGGFGLAVGLASLITNYYVFAAALILVGFSSLTMLTSANAYVQTTTPASYRGRVMAIYAAVVMGGTPLGAPLAGWVADAFGPRMSMAVGAASGLLAFAVGLVWMIVAKNLRLTYDPKSRIRLHVSYLGHP
jgi:MFS family permease